MDRAVIDHNGIEVLDDEACLELLRSRAIGRIGLSVNALPLVLPVNYVVDGSRVVFRSNPGTKLEQALRGAVVCFEVDDFDPTYHAGWSVIVTGRATEITEREDLAHVERLPLRPWAPIEGGHYIAVDMEMLSGRRFPEVR
jgi:uncharacterized protein